MAYYEHTIVGKQDLSDKEMQGLIDKYSKIIDKSGKILKTEKWGLLNLANKIKKNIHGTKKMLARIGIYRDALPYEQTVYFDNFFIGIEK